MPENIVNQCIQYTLYTWDFEKVPVCSKITCIL